MSSAVVRTARRLGRLIFEWVWYKLIESPVLVAKVETTLFDRPTKLNDVVSYGFQRSNYSVMPSEYCLWFVLL